MLHNGNRSKPQREIYGTSSPACAAGTHFQKPFSLLGDKSFRPNPLLGSREGAANPVTLPGVNKWSSRGQGAEMGPKRAFFCQAHLVASSQAAPQRCGRAQAPELGCFFPQTVAIIIIKQLTPITPSSPRSQGMDTAQGKFAAASPLHILI